MKILTLNTHSLVEDNYEEKLCVFIDAAAREQPDIMGLQEVNQTVSARTLPQNMLRGYHPCDPFGIAIREDNHAARIAALLSDRGVAYHWTWIPVKLGYNIYDEGLALFSKDPILDTVHFQISMVSDYNNWKTRKVLGILCRTGWFYTVHMGWWNDIDEPFYNQWKQADANIKKQAGTFDATNVWIMGDFNSPSSIRGQGYDLVKADGWKDTWELAQIKDTGITVDQVIDGWRNKTDQSQDQGMRIDYIWTLNPVSVKSSRIIFDGKRYSRVSDHNGIIAEIID